MRRLLDALFPRRCPLCGALLDAASDRLCPDCAAVWRHECGARCARCGERAPDCRCLPRALSGVPVRALAAAAFYDPPRLPQTAALLYRLKENPDGAAAAVFSRALSSLLLSRLARMGETPSAWRLTYLPRTPQAVRRFGFDQGRRLCRLCARSTGIPSASLFTRRAGEEQKTLGAAARQQNAAASLSLARTARVRGGRFILLDDIVTSGATMAAAARLLLDGGAEAVFLLCAARSCRVQEPTE